jgi:hypothetical protein
MKKDKMLPILIIVLSINFLSLGLMMLNSRSCEKEPIVKYIEGKVAEEEMVEMPQKSNIIGRSGQNDEFFIYGVLKEEPIPEELQLGDSWYWVYFDEPYLLVENALGVPQYVDKIQVYPSEYVEFYDIEDFVNERVEIYGYLTSGYAESTVFQITSIREY